MVPKHADVLIVGAGPTGLALATALQLKGVDHVLIDALPEGQNTSRAAVIHAQTLEAMESLGMVGTLMDQGVSLTRFTIRDRDRPLLEIGFSDLPSRFQSLLMVPQSTTEQVLAERLTELGGRVHRSAKAVKVWQDATSAFAAVATSEGEKLISARYIVGADGMHSAVRQAAEIPFDGSTYGESFVLADVRMDWPLGRTEVSLFFSPNGLVVVAPLPDGSFRIVATVNEAPENPQVSDMQALLDARGPSTGRCVVNEVVWGSRFRVHHRLARDYRRGRLLLMGDAAHVHSPAGGQGMNTGLVDAISLGEALGDVIMNGAPESVLDDYAAMRRQAAEQVLTLAGRLTGAATVRSPVVRLLRNLVLRTLNRLAPAKAKIALALSGVSRRSLSRTPARVEQLTVAAVEPAYDLAA